MRCATRQPRMRCFIVLLGALSCALHGAAIRAHGDEYFDTRPSAHGGQTRMAGPMHIELVIAGTQATLYITDHADQPQLTAGGKARLRLPGMDEAIELVPAGDNRFTGTLASPPGSDAAVVAFVQLAGDEAQSARFGPRTRAASTDGHDHAPAHQPAPSPADLPIPMQHDHGGIHH